MADAPTGASDAVVGVVSGIVAAAVVGGTTKTGRVVVVDGDVVLVATTKGKVDGTTTTDFNKSTSQAVPSLSESRFRCFLYSAALIDGFNFCFFAAAELLAIPLGYLALS